MTAIGAVESVGAEAHVAVVGRVDARGAVQARVVGARLLRRRLAAQPVEAGRALARRVRLTLSVRTPNNTFTFHSPFIHSFIQVNSINSKHIKLMQSIRNASSQFNQL